MTFPEPILVTKTADLAALCRRLAGEPFVTIDTEFIRESTYYPQLCVVQLAGAAEVAVIDAEAPGLDLAPLGALLADRAVTKVFHAARQDVEIFLHRFGAPPAPIFDTQVAAMVAGFGDQVAYDGLVAALAGGVIDKSHRFTDWAARPLTEAQIAYASADVTYLRLVYEALLERLEREDRLGWVAEEMAGLSEAGTYLTDPETAWERLRPRTNNRRMLNRLRAAARWRELRAREMDLPRGRLLKDESLLEIAATGTRGREDLARVRGVGRGFAEGAMGGALLEALREAEATPETEWPSPAKSGPRPSPALMALLKVLLAAKGEEHKVAARLIASGEELERLATEEGPDVPALHGWRRGVFGEDALALCGGRLSLGVAGRRVRLVRG